jgi:carbon-monoxide dehydrogenase medium subunit
MLPRSFQYLAPTSLEEASSLLREHQGDAKVLAGGMSLIPLMKMRLASPGYVVDINRVPGLDYVKLSDDGRSLLVGPLARHHSVESSSLVRTKAPLLAEAAGSIGDPQVRNLGTVGGALAHSDPSGDWGTAILAMRGTVKVLGQSGERSIAMDDFLLDTFTTALKEDDLIAQVSIPLPTEGKSGGAYLKLERKAGDFATVAVAAQVTLEEKKDGSYFSNAGIGLTAVGPKNLRAKDAERSLLGRKVTKDAIAEASMAAAKECSPTDDPLRGSAKYKREMTGLFTRRAIELAVARARNAGKRVAT